MSKPQSPPRGFPVIALMSSEEALLNECENTFYRKLGKPTADPMEYLFSHSSYYEKEMGQGLMKRLICPGQVISAEELPQLKHFADETEKAFLKDKQNRRINIDPGFLTLPNFQLLTFKNFSHRAYIGNQVFAELTLIFSSKEKSFETLPWTYSDYSNPQVINWLVKLRTQLMEQG